MELPESPEHRMQATRRQGWTLAIVSIGLFMVVLDNLVVTVALPSIHRDPGRLDPVTRMDRQRLRALLCGAAADRRGARRPVGRKRMFVIGVRCSRRLGRRGARAQHGALIAARAVQGAGGAIVDAADADPARAGVSAAAARPRTRCLVGHQRHRRRTRPAGRRRGDPGQLLALDLLDQRSGRVGAGADSRRAGCRRASVPTRDLDLRGLALASSGLFGLSSA